MKTFRTTIALFFLVALTVPLASAQLSHNNLPWKVQVPFSFHVGNKIMPSGTYQVRTVGDSVFLSSLDGKSVAVLMPALEDSSNPESANSLIFNGYGTNQFLSRVVLSGTGQVGQLTKSKMEREFAKQSTGTAETVAGE